ncbi:SNF2/RAD54 family helicase [Amycolatopsis mediterranei S699]|uniref:SNF2/RAD54 family helicase n=3 Tax=Amycolatopsis mediterranei TaxID=33910 RepID=A0A0H3D456_AMYMU|nr:DEAD/DEAH box helicase [Amycolatopsis mediterranei]ADJ44298.1 SNF2/RAD54 family helicase [Amycolatopsis mediterranei U32]AEK41035.1 SNF2/RAD54 family helicase [Amycolatopsis mediterranei S699]AFO76011.1 SNF2/RAD54 family helicase [Amycolatopsis mediterranei S699]AGT83140.1 SNF2/RAD54 family helicase [Amycolatopsis mediterranei RB]KDO06785.1 helicase SNF2 [Amycolatopsis mediterranei]
MEFSADTQATYLPADPPRDGVLALWGEDVAGGTTIELVLPRGAKFARTKVDAELIPLERALPRLLSVGEEASPAVAAWSAAVNAGVNLVARGRLRPAASPGGAAAWRIGPLDAADEELLRGLAGALPPEAYALPLTGLKRIRLHSPDSLVRALWDATADLLVRSPAAPVGAGDPAFAAREPALLGPDGAAWLAELEAREPRGIQVLLRVEGLDDDSFAGVLAVRSMAEPSLVVEAATLWDAPDAVLNRLGDQVETQLLLGLRRGARAWAPLGRVLTQATPDSLALSDEEVVDLLTDGARDLGGAGIEVLWSKGLFAAEVKAKASATQAPASVTEAEFALRSLLEFRWQLSLGGEQLTEAEVAALAEAKRPLVRLRGQWVRVDPQFLARVRGRTRKLDAGEALAAALTGELELDGERVEFAAPPALGGLASRIRERADVLAAPPPGLHATLRPYQQAGLSWLATMTGLGLGACLADDMGLGKTIQLIALHLHRRDLARSGALPPSAKSSSADSAVEPSGGPTLVLCPTSLLGNWEREFARFAPEIPVRRFHGGGRHLDDLAPDEVVLATYGVLRRDRETLSEVDWGLIAADEAQHVKNPLSATAKELRKVPAQAKVALTGTPVENRLTELWSIVDWTTPGLLGPLDRFRRTVARPIERDRDKAVTERLAATVRPFLLRRRKSDPDIAPELPPKTETDRFVPLTAEQTTLYEAVVRENLAEIRETQGIKRRGQVLQLLNELKQICNHPAQFLKEPHGALTGRSGKLAAFEELLDVILDEGESVLVFSQYVQLCRLLERRLKDRGLPTELLSGERSPAKRQDMVDRFQAGEIPVFLLSLKAGGVGLNLTRATHVIHYDRWWNPAVEDQATDRAYRIGQDRPVQVHRLIAEGTLEERIAQVLEKKRGLAESIVGAGEDWITELSDDELADLVRLGSG